MATISSMIFGSDLEAPSNNGKKKSGENIKLSVPTTQTHDCWKCIKYYGAHAPSDYSKVLADALSSRRAFESAVGTGAPKNTETLARATEKVVKMIQTMCHDVRLTCGAKPFIWSTCFCECRSPDMFGSGCVYYECVMCHIACGVDKYLQGHRAMKQAKPDYPSVRRNFEMAWATFIYVKNVLNAKMKFMEANPMEDRAPETVPELIEVLILMSSANAQSAVIQHIMASRASALPLIPKLFSYIKTSYEKCSNIIKTYRLPPCCHGSWEEKFARLSYRYSFMMAYHWMKDQIDITDVASLKEKEYMASLARLKILYRSCSSMGMKQPEQLLGKLYQAGEKIRSGVIVSGEADLGPDVDVDFVIAEICAACPPLKPTDPMYAYDGEKWIDTVQKAKNDGQ